MSHSMVFLHHYRNSSDHYEKDLFAFAYAHGIVCLQ